MTDRATWQPQIDGAPGSRVTGIDELAQSLSLVIATPLGSVPGRPLFGSKVFELISAPLDEVRARAPAYVRDAALQNLPRIELRDTRATPSAAGAIDLEVDWVPVGQVAAPVQTTMVPVQ